MKHCKGCYAYTRTERSPCSISGYNKKGECPCTTCIIKVMCNKTCDDFFWFQERTEDECRYAERYNL